MAARIASVVVRNVQRKALFRLPLVLAQRNYGVNISDYAPGPPPKTKEEREAAARKYNLIPEDYEVHDLDQGFGDYPKLPPASQDSRDPYEDFDYHYRRMNWGEPMYDHYDLISSDVHDPNFKLRTPLWKQVCHLLIFLSIIGSGFIADYYFDIRLNHVRKPKQYPGPGKVHYTFEPEYD